MGNKDAVAAAVTGAGALAGDASCATAGTVVAGFASALDSALTTLGSATVGVGKPTAFACVTDDQERESGVALIGNGRISRGVGRARRRPRGEGGSIR